MRLRLLGLLVLVPLLAVLAPSRADAQVGMGTDIITGVVTGEDGSPVQDATVEAYSLETEITRRARTDARGRFTILFPDGGGQYRMTARVMGMSPRIQLLVRHADEDRLVWNIQLRAGAVTIDAIDVRTGPNVSARADAPTPGSSERAFTADQLARFPLDIADVSVLASLVPGVLALAATDTTATAFSVAGLGADANALTLDGLLFGTATMPQEGLRQTRVVTSTYDVSRGQFSGGLIASTTRSGSNMVQGSSQYQLREQELAWTGEDSPYSQGFTQHQFSGGLGGPLLRDRLFVYASGQARLRSDPQQTLLSADGSDFTRLGVSPDSVARFLDILTALGVPPRSTPNAATRASDNFSGLGRLDWVVSGAHSLTLRGDWRGTSQDPTRLGPLALPQSGGAMSSSGGGAMLTFTSRFGATVLNEFRGYWQTSRNDGDAFVALPAGRVQVASDLPDSSRGVTTLSFGGNTGMPSRSRSNNIELSNELSWLPGAGRHRVKLGGSFNADRSRNIVGSNLLGTYTFNSLADLEAGRPAAFRRTLEMAERRSDSQRYGFFAGDVWMVTRPFQLTYGVRLEGSTFSDPPAYNPAVEAAFGRRTDRLPSEWHVSPRVGFTWTLGGAPFARGRMPMPPTLVIRGGVGEFRNQPSANLVAQARGATGLDRSAAEIFCIGSGVPSPEWGQFLSDPDSIPGACLGGGPPVPGTLQASRTVALIGDGFQAPRAWRGSLGLERRLTQIFRLTVDASLARGVSQTGWFDLNLIGTPRFTLASEGNRPIYVAPADITPTTGVPRFTASRLDSVFGHVLEARSALASRSAQVTVGLGGVVGRGLVLQTSYTFQRARDQQTGARGGGTAGDPNVIEWGRSDMERRHSFLLTATYPVTRALEITSIGRLTSGAPFTPTVGGDVNGDGSRNDRAFIFAPGTGSAEAQAMSRLLEGASGSVRSCLQRQAGTVAARNSCAGPWQASWELQANYRPFALGLNGRLSVSVVTVNLLRGLDEVIHGSANVRGWGLNTRPDGTLLYVTGFDAAAQRFRYEVNERFGATSGSATAFRPPFQVGIQVRYTIGPDRMRAALDAIRGGGGPGMMGMGGLAGGLPGGAGGGPGGGRGPAGSPLEILARIDSAIPNPAGIAIGMRDSLRLDSSQVVLLIPVRDTLAAHNQMRLDSLRRVIQRQGDNLATMMQVMPVLRPLFEAARAEVAQSLVTVRAILREDQWMMLPETARDPSAMLRRGLPGMGPGQGPGGRPVQRPIRP